MVLIPGFYTKTAKPTRERSQGTTHQLPATAKKTLLEMSTQSNMESTESRMASNPHMEDPFLVGMSTADLSHSHLDFVHQFTHVDTFQRDIDQDLGRFDLSLAENKSHKILSENKSPSMSSHNILKPQHPNIPSKPPTMPLTPPTLLFDSSNLKVSPQNKVNPTTWKRIPRTRGDASPDTTEILGQKRPASNPTNHAMLPNKKTVVSQIGKENV